MTINNTVENPNEIETRRASIAPLTDSAPLIPHAQGISPFRFFESIDTPVGNGMPRKNAPGAIKITAKTILARNGQPIRTPRIPGKASI